MARSNGWMTNLYCFSSHWSGIRIDISAPTAIFLRHGEVLYVVVLISRRSSNSAIFLSVKYPLEPPVTLQY
jgi:hypothetical protein